MIVGELTRLNVYICLFFFCFLIKLIRPTGIKIWATARVYRELSCQMNSPVEWTKDCSTYPTIAKGGGQQPVLKRVMRSLVVAISYCRTKIDLKVIAMLRMRVNYLNSSFFGHDSARIWKQLLQIFPGCLKVKIYFKDNSKTGTLLIALGTGNKRVSLTINSRVLYAIGEVLSHLTHDGEDGRGSVVLLSNRKGSNSLYSPIGQYRSYSTRSKANKLVSVRRQPDPRITKDYETLAKHWFNCYQDTNRVFADLRGLLKLDSIWFAAYLKLKKNKGANTPGPDFDNIDSLTRKRILEIKQAVLKKEFSWTGVRQLMIPKPGKPGKFRPLGIPAINDRLVQEVIRSIIEPVFELNFSENSHGFRPNRSCHTALKQINTRMKDSIWYIEGDIKSYFDTIDHDILLALIEKRITDPLILNLIKSGLKAKVFTQDKKTYVPEVGTPQGGILSPLLSNIYLHELDLFMDKLSTKYQESVSPANRKKNPLARALLNGGKKSQYYKLRIPSRIPNEKGYRNCKYIRYADDFLVGVLGPRSLAIKIRQQIDKFLREELKINLSLEKTKITHISNKIPFLGYLFSRRTIFIKQHFSGKLVNRKMTIPTLDVDLDKVIRRLADAGFCDRSGEPLPAFRFLRLPQSQVNAKVNRILRGLSQWWSIAGNRKRAVAYVAYIIRYSVAKVYAAKFKMKTVARVFKIGGNDLKKPLGVRAKSVVGADEKNVPKGAKQMEGILFDRYHKIPEPEGNKLPATWQPDYLKLLEKSANFQKFLKKFMGTW